MDRDLKIIQLQADLAAAKAALAQAEQERDAAIKGWAECEAS